MQQLEQITNKERIRLGRELEASLTVMRITHIEFSAEGDEIDGRVFDIAYFIGTHEVSVADIPTDIQVVVRGRLELDAKIYDLTPKNGGAAARLRWDLVEC